MIRISAAVLAGLAPLSLAAEPVNMLFIGNSYTFGRTDPAMSYNSGNVTDLTSPERGGTFTDLTGSHAFEPHPWGGVPGIFKQLTDQAGLDYNVYLSTRNAASLRGHLLNSNPANWDLRGNMELMTWDKVVLQEQSANPLVRKVNEHGHDLGSDPEGFRYYADAIKNLVKSPEGTGELRDRDSFDGDTIDERQAACEAAGSSRVTCSRSRGEYVNPNASSDTQVYLYQTWARPNLIHGAFDTVRDDSDGSVSWLDTQSTETHYDTLEEITAELVAGYQDAFDYALQQGSTSYEGIAPVGQAFLSAVQSGVAARDFWANEAEATGSVDLWFEDGTHASKYGSYLSALTLFGETTGLDPLLFAEGEIAAQDMGISAEDAFALQRVASFLLNLIAAESSGDDLLASAQSAGGIVAQMADIVIAQQDTLNAHRLRAARGRLAAPAETGRFTPTVTVQGAARAEGGSAHGAGDVASLTAHVGGVWQHSADLSFGGTISLQRSNSDLRHGGDISAETVSAGLDAAWQRGGTWVVAGVGFSKSRLSGVRNFAMVSGLGYEFLQESFDVDTHAYTLNASLQGGHVFRPNSDFSYGPVFGIDYSRTRIGGHSEGTARRAVSYGKLDFESIELQLGGQMTRKVTLAGRPVTLSADLRYVRELAEGRPSMAMIVDSAGTTRAVAGADFDKSFGRIGLSAQMQLSPQAVSWLSLDGRIGHRGGAQARLGAGISVRF
ncbi:autotransporter outer membrane beta-barrel domain-containing protein [Szabonella alba]|uniref:Autotransporter outer membrane beta-barrel domain-containing protein n=1 Tax=Szabonella alba TaxID=2804194 RepID=A0A8K0V6W7_9RHOB|nr:autotransporter outer membrane beta-barrel domain-containing protein [Szabonella alba]MBL4916854.1 autotransporter outer membrane beta-barrel domain-containing protein [Szabonella alba]